MPAHHLTQRPLLAIGLTALALTGACDQIPEPTGRVTLLANSDQLASPVDDAVLTSSVRKALLADPAIGGFELQVNTQKGTVQLSGFVNHQAQIARALAIAHAVAGVKTVENSLTLKSSPDIVGIGTGQAVLAGWHGGQPPGVRP